MLNPDKLASLFMNSRSATKRSQAKASYPPSGQTLCAPIRTSISSTGGNGAGSGSGSKKEAASSASAPYVIDLDGDSDGEAAESFDYGFMGGRGPVPVNTSSSNSTSVNAQSNSSIAATGNQDFTARHKSLGGNQACVNSSSSGATIMGKSGSSNFSCANHLSSSQRTQGFRMDMTAAIPQLPQQQQQQQSKPTWQENREKFKHVFQPKVLQSKTTSSSSASGNATTISIVDLSTEGD